MKSRHLITNRALKPVLTILEATDRTLRVRCGFVGRRWGVLLVHAPKKGSE